MHRFCHIFIIINFNLLFFITNIVFAKNDINNFFTSTPFQLTNINNKIEVIEFFWYDCLHCAEFDLTLNIWAKKQENKVIYKQIPVGFHPSFIPQQKLFYTLEAMDKIHEINPKIFHAIHIEHQTINTDKTILKFIETQNINKKKFIDLYNSFKIKEKLLQTKKLQQKYKINGVPSIVIGDRYITFLTINESSSRESKLTQKSSSLQIIDFLLNKLILEQYLQKTKFIHTRSINVK